MKVSMMNHFAFGSCIKRKHQLGVKQKGHVPDSFAVVEIWCRSPKGYGATEIHWVTKCHKAKLRASQ